MTKLTELQDQILRAAAQADDGSIRAQANARSVAALIKRGLMISVPQAEGASLWLITEAGRALVAPPAKEAPAEQAAPIAPTLATAPNAASEPTGKTGQLIGLLRRPDGATIQDMMAATGWQAHSIRGAMSGALKKARGLDVISQMADGVRRYSLQAL